MSNMKKVLVVISLLLLTVVSVPRALSYFYTYTDAKGTLTVKLSDESSFHEYVESGMKYLTITAEEDSDPIFVRAKAITTSDVILKYDIPEGTPADAWESGDDGYRYYRLPIDGREDSALGKTAKLNVEITLPEGGTPGDTKNVVVLYEATPAYFCEERADVPANAKIVYELSDGSGFWYTTWEEILVND